MFPFGKIEKHTTLTKYWKLAPVLKEIAATVPAKKVLFIIWLIANVINLSVQVIYSIIVSGIHNHFSYLILTIQVIFLFNSIFKHAKIEACVKYKAFQWDMLYDRKLSLKVIGPNLVLSVFWWVYLVVLLRVNLVSKAFIMP